MHAAASLSLLNRPVTLLPLPSPTLQAQRDGAYPNIFSRTFKAATASANAAAAAAAAVAAAPARGPSAAAGGAPESSLLPGLKVDLALVTSIYTTYIQCQGGNAEVKACGPGTFFEYKRKRCSPTFRNGTAPGTQVPGCRKAGCFCQGRQNGMYANPEKPESGLICSNGKVYLFDCPPSYAYKDKIGCVHKTLPGFMGPPGSNPVPVATAGEGAPAGANASVVPDALSFLPRAG